MSADSHATKKRSLLSYIADVFRGFLIGMAELVPGISGGTVALIVGIYEKALHNADLLVRRKFREVDWLFLVLVGIGMVGAVFGMSTLMHTFVSEYTDMSNGLFLGMVAVSILVPVGMMDRRTASWKLVALFVPSAIIGFIATGYISEPVENPSLIVIFFAAAIAICALMIPGVSGSFLLLAMGLYEPIVKAVSERDLSVIVVFCLGALLGAVSFVRALSWLFKTHRNTALAVMSGLMLGSLRALWPWKDGDFSNAGPVIGMIILGALIVAAFIVADRRKSTHQPAEVVEEDAPRV
ncbi:DUF368 domain-containing protein [Corynebacterium breve]|uniref:DUF368 domain-containing protein n=1 Tax=Corynebacterium breve TaxID=3049799 RepID=A0ABY8VJD0_9CORY|nr:DUF368 domain-containing protein [Corynebacterium breve]WIM68738.1 DUF368 domain-containing protein [Corynebacterium breve]